MKRITLALLAIIVFGACQQKQYFTSSPEIDIVKKGNEAYMKGDWATFRTVYADTAKLMTNSWDPKKSVTPDDYIKSEQDYAGMFSDRKISDDAIYEMVVTDDGEKWVHLWALWSGTHRSGQKVEIPIHISFLMVNGKVAFQADFYNELAIYLAENPPADKSTGD